MQDYLESTFNEENPDDVAQLDEISLWSAPFGLTLLDMVQMRKGIRALDVGFGTGFPLIELAGRLGETSTVHGIDRWEAAVNRANQKIRIRGLKNINIHLGNAENLPFEDEYFDLIVSNNGINNVDDADKAVSECSRVCRRGGQFVFTFNLPGTMHEMYWIFENVLRKRGMTAEIQKMKAHIHEKRKSIEETSHMVDRLGFHVREVSEKMFKYRFADAGAMFRYFTIRQFFLPPWRALLPESQVSEIFNELENQLNEIQAKFGELRLSIPYVCFDCRKP